MLEIRGGLDLLHEAFGAEDRREFRPQAFDGDLAVVLDVVHKVDGRHAALAEFALDGVAIRKCGGESLN